VALVTEPGAPAPPITGSSRPSSAPSGSPEHPLRHRILRLWREAVLVVLAFQAYRLVRLASEGNRAIAVRHGTTILRWEQRVGLAWEHGVQDFVLRHDGLLAFCNTWYTWAFWPTVTGTMLVLYLWHPKLYRRYRNAVFLSGAIGLTVFALFPTAPPRMLVGFVDTVHEFSSAGGFAHPTGFTNEYAAMPSFHVGWLLLAGAALMPLLRRRALHTLLLLPAAVMFFVVMATANHYVLDGLAGAAIVVLGLAAADRIAALDLRLRDVRYWAQSDAAAAVVVLASGRAVCAYQEALTTARRDAARRVAATTVRSPTSRSSTASNSATAARDGPRTHRGPNRSPRPLRTR
jgi:hypothetical protein